MEDSPLVGLICLNYNGLSILHNGKPIIQLCLDSILLTKYKKSKFVLVDASSEDGSVEFVKYKYPNVDCIKVPNIGWE